MLPIASATNSALIPTRGNPPPGWADPPTQKSPFTGERFFARENADIAFVAHPSFGGLPIAPSFLFAKLFRLIGADATIFPNYGGRFSYSQEECHRIASYATGPSLPVKPCVPVPAGGMELKRVPELLAFFGKGVMLLIGGSLLSAKENITAETAKFCDAVRHFA